MATITTTVDVDVDFDEIIDEMSNRELLEAKREIEDRLGGYMGEASDESLIILEEINTFQEKELFANIKKIYQNRVRLSQSEFITIFQIAKNL